VGPRRKEWAPLLDDDEHAGALVPIFALAYEHEPDPERRPYSGPIGTELREKLIVGIAAGVMKITGTLRSKDRALRTLSQVGDTFRRIAPKTGRNELCPCGSGKKFKKCCSGITLH
jgi:uncharacterized protein